MAKKIDAKSAAIILVDGNKALLNLRDNKPNISYPNHWGFAGGGNIVLSLGPRLSETAC